MSLSDAGEDRGWRLTSGEARSTITGMETERFLEELDRAVQSALADLGKASAAAEPAAEVGIADLLAVALKKELEASEEAALWMTREDDIEVKLAFARQCGDEAKHYRLIEARLREMGVEPSALGAKVGGPSPMFQFLAGLGTTVERIAAGQFTREALALAHNQVFIEYCEAKGDRDTARLYRDVIQPDEGHHHEMGRQLLRRLAAPGEAQVLARAAAAKTLVIAAEIQEMARLKKGIARAPGC
jgi:bacterioferritin (cytochrome b1)